MKTFFKGSITKTGNNIGLLMRSMADRQMIMNIKDASSAVSECAARVSDSVAPVSDGIAHVSDYDVSVSGCDVRVSVCGAHVSDCGTHVSDCDIHVSDDGFSAKPGPLICANDLNQNSCLTIAIESIRCFINHNSN